MYSSTFSKIIGIYMLYYNVYISTTYLDQTYYQENVDTMVLYSSSARTRSFTTLCKTITGSNVSGSLSNIQDEVVESGTGSMLLSLLPVPLLPVPRN
jgi:hypothetical protein